MKKYLRVGEVASQLGVSSQTIRRYEKEGRIEGTRSVTGQRLFTQETVDKLLGKETENTKSVVFYVRESNANLKSTLENQIKMLKSEYGQPDKVYKDLGSGLNEKRKGLHQLLNDAKNRKFDTVCIIAKDRLTRFGFTYLEELLSEYNVNIEVLDDRENKKDAHEELIEDFMSLLASFSGKYYRLRSNKNQKLFLSDIEKKIDER